MSYLSQLRNRQISTKQFLAKSVNYLSAKMGLTVSDAAVDAAVARTDHLTDTLNDLIGGYIKAALPGLPAAIAIAATNAALNTIDAAIAGAGQAIKDATPDTAKDA